jgi:hypothetical protein
MSSGEEDERETERERGGERKKFIKKNANSLYKVY